MVFGRIWIFFCHILKLYYLPQTWEQPLLWLVIWPCWLLGKNEEPFKIILVDFITKDLRVLWVPEFWTWTGRAELWLEFLAREGGSWLKNSFSPLWELRRTNFDPSMFIKYLLWKISNIYTSRKKQVENFTN